MSPRASFEQELEQLKQSVMEMGNRVENEYVQLFEALNAKETEGMERLIKCDRIVNDMQRGIEARCLMLFTRQQPVARDLRMVSAALKVVTDIERIGDHVCDMAELFLRMNLPNLTEFSSFLPSMVKETREMIHDSVEAFVGRDMAKANEVIQKDDVVDNYFNLVKNDLISLLKEEKKEPDDCIDILMVTKYLEKMGDHAVNIGEWEHFQETGSIQNIRIL